MTDDKIFDIFYSFTGKFGANSFLSVDKNVFLIVLLIGKNVNLLFVVHFRDLLNEFLDFVSFLLYESN